MFMAAKQHYLHKIDLYFQRVNTQVDIVKILCQNSKFQEFTVVLFSLFAVKWQITNNGPLGFPRHFQYSSDRASIMSIVRGE